MTLETWEEMIEAQQNLCLICRMKEPNTIDHCHTTSKVRGLLCDPCNKGLGFFRDSISSLKNAIEYLETK